MASATTSSDRTLDAEARRILASGLMQVQHASCAASGAN